MSRFPANERSHPRTMTQLAALAMFAAERAGGGSAARNNTLRTHRAVSARDQLLDSQRGGFIFNMIAAYVAAAQSDPGRVCLY